MKLHRIDTQSVLLYFLLQFLLAFLLLLLTQGLFWWVNQGLFLPGGGWRILLGNLHFGLSGTAYALLPFALMMAIPIRRRWWDIASRCGLGLGVAFLLAANVADIPYFQWTLRRTAGDIFAYLGQNFDGGLLIGQMLKDFWPYFLLFFLLYALWIVAQLHLRLTPGRNRWWVGLILLALNVTCIRGGWILQHKPLAPVDASRYAPAQNQALVLNTPFSILRTLGNTASVKPVHYFEDEELEQIFNPIHTNNQQPKTKNHNVVVLILESFSEEYIGAINQGGRSWTPFLDSLSAHCLLFQGRANGKRSIESLPALFLGIPSLMDEAYITSTFSQNRTLSLPQILARHGYTSAFFHGAYNGSMNFDAFCQQIGFDRYYGMDQYPSREDFDGTWGIFDEPFLRWSATELATLPQPFFATLYTISSHHPYTIPPQHKGRFPKGEIPLLETIGYTDYALRRFFAEAARQPWFDSTLFVITADHAAQPLSDYYRANAYCVPMLLYSPGLTPERRDQLFQHIDLMPTLLDLLGLPDSCLSFGHSALCGEGYHVARPGSYYIMERAGEQLTFDGERFAPEEGPEENRRFLKALLQQYNNRMIENRLLP